MDSCLSCQTHAFATDLFTLLTLVTSQQVPAVKHIIDFHLDYSQHLHRVFLTHSLDVRACLVVMPPYLTVHAILLFSVFPDLFFLNLTNPEQARYEWNGCSINQSDFTQMHMNLQSKCNFPPAVFLFSTNIPLPLGSWPVKEE